MGQWSGFSGRFFSGWVRLLIISGLIFGAYYWVKTVVYQNEILKKMIARLEADSRAAQVLVTAVQYNEEAQKTFTTIKFLEFDAAGKPLAPQYFTFSGNIIQFQALVIRFDDMKIKYADKLKGKSAYLFLKAFMLDGKNTQEFVISPASGIPAGYKVEGAHSRFEEKLWENFWKYAFHADAAKQMSIKNAQIEAPGTMFIPGTLYTIKIEHDGGLRIDAEPLPAILKGETIQ